MCLSLEKASRLKQLLKQLQILHRISSNSMQTVTHFSGHSFSIPQTLAASQRPEPQPPMSPWVPELCQLHGKDTNLHHIISLSADTLRAEGYKLFSKHMSVCFSSSFSLNFSYSQAASSIGPLLS